MENILNFLKRNKDARKIFGERELKIIEKQLLGINLTQSEKNRLSRDIRPKFNFIKDFSNFSFDTRLKKSAIIKGLIEETKEIILEHPLRNKINKIFLFGSAVENTLTFRSDIDIAVLFDKISEKEATIFRSQISGKTSDKIDIQVFNFLPKKIKKSILSDHKTIYEK